MEEIGCHFKFEKIIGNKYHDTELMLSSGRNCLRYILKEKGITTLFLPYFLCESLSEVAMLENIEIKYYHIDENYEPTDIDTNRLNENSYIYIVNYYGLFRNKNKDYIDKYKYVILDNTHDFFDKTNYDANVIYNYRKYFGVPDGACIVSNDLDYNPIYARGKSLEKIIEMVSRDETGEYFHYSTFLEADKHFKNEDLKYISSFTENYLQAIDYSSVQKQRLSNYRILASLLKKYNVKNLDIMETSYMYPLFVEDGVALRKFLKENNIYSLKLWANVNWNGSNEKEISMADNTVLLPIDQRYSDSEMEYIAQQVDKYYSKQKIKTLTRGI